MNRTRIAAAVVLLALAAGGLALAVAAGAGGLLPSEDGFRNSELDSFETTAPASVGPWADNSSTVNRPARGGTRLILSVMGGQTEPS